MQDFCAMATYLLLTTVLVILVLRGHALPDPKQGGQQQTIMAGDTKQFVLFPDVGYYEAFLSDAFNWTEAHSYCQEMGGHLAIANSDAEAEVFKSLIEAQDVAYQNLVYVGYHDRFVDGRYETVQGYPVAQSGYMRWAAGVPNTGPTLHCGAFSKVGGLVNVDCTEPAISLTICEKPLWFDYEFYPGVGYYKMHLEATTWPEAWATCRDEGAHLAIINSDEEHQVLQEIFARHPNAPGSTDSRFAWVGVHANFAYGQIQTLFGMPIADSGFNTWITGHPESGVSSGRHFVALSSELFTSVGLALMDPKIHIISFFCEHPLSAN